MFPIAFTSVYAKAQTLSMYEAVNKTIANYPLLQERSQEVAASRSHIMSVNDNRLPSLLLSDQLTTGTSNNLEGSYFPLGMIPSTDGGINAENNPTAATGNLGASYLQWDFYNFGYINAQRKEAKSELAVSQSKLNRDTYLLTENVISLYLDWVKKYRLMLIEKENVHRAETILNAIRAITQGGMKPGVDSATAIAAYGDAQIAYLQASYNYDDDKITLAAYTDISRPGMTPDTGIIEKVLGSDLFRLPLADSVSINHPLLDVYREQYEQQRVTNDVISKKYLPKFSLYAAGWMRGTSITSNGVYEDDAASGLPYSRYNYLFGLTLSYNVFDLKRRHDLLSEGEYVAKASESAMQTQKLELTKTLHKADTAFSDAIRKLRILPVQLSSAQQAFIQQSAMYSAGLNTLIDVTNAQYVLRQSETNYVLAQDQLLQLLYIKAGLNNELDAFLQNLK
jgi:outer membrane protein TolC